MPQTLEELYSGVASAPIPDETPIRPVGLPTRTESTGSSLDSLYPDQSKKLDDISWQATIKGYLSTASGLAKKAADTVLPGFVDTFQAKQREGAAKTTGNFATLFDMIWNTPTFVVTHGAVAPITAASRMVQGESPDIAYKMGSEGASTLLEGSPYTNPARKFLEMFKSGKLYEESGTAKGMEKVTETLKAGDKWAVDTLKVPPGSFTMMAEQLMAGTPGALVAAKDAAASARLQKQIAKVKETYIPSDRADFIVSSEGVATPTSPFKPNYVGRPATLDQMYEKPPSMTEAPVGPELSAAAHEQVPISAVAKPRIKAKVAGAADPEFLSTVAALGMGGATAAILWNESERTGKSVLDVIKNWPNRHPAQGEFDQEPVNPDTGNALAQNLAAGIPIAGMMIPLRKGSPRELAATALEKGGATRTDIWDKLQVWKPTTDNHWRWELSDREAKIAEGLPQPKGRPGEVSPVPLFGEAELGDILQHPELYKVDPFAERTTVRHAALAGDRVTGAYQEPANMFLAREGTPEKLRTTLLHEQQHRQQARGDLARGGSPEDFMTPEMKARREELTGTINDLRDADPHLAKLDESLLGDALLKRQAGVALHPAEQTIVRNASNSYKFPELAKVLIERHQLDLEAYRKYRRLAGEAEARLVEKRRDMTNEERQARPPWEDFDVPEWEQITRFKVGPALSVKEKGGMWHPDAEYQKYVQDFVRSGKWGEVGDLENTGLITRGNFRGYEVQLPPEGRGGTRLIDADTLGLEEGKYYTPDEISKLKKDQRGFSTPDFTRALGLTAAGAAVGAALADSTDKLAGAAIGGLLAFGLSTGAGQRISRKSKIYREVERSVTGTIDQFIRKVNPDLLGKDAEQASAILGSNYVEMMRRELEQGIKGEDRRKFWEGRSEIEKNNFIRSLGLPGVKYKDPEIQQLAQYYRKWQEDIQNENKTRNIKPTSGDHYANHIFEDPDRAIAYIANKHGNDWYKSPDSVLFVAQAEAAGYKMKSTNPEQVLLAQQHAADIANLKVNALNEIVDAGLARKVKKGDPPPGPGEVLWQSPDGGRYYLSDHANQVMHNAFETPSLWNAPGLGGMTYRGAMWGKNALVPTLLMSMFHPLHITAGMIYGTTGVNAIKLMAAGKLGVGEVGLEMGKSLAFVDTAKTLPYVAKAMQPRGMRAFRGEIDPADLTTLDHLQTQNALDGGFSPEMSVEYRNQHIKAFQDAIRRKSVNAVWNLPFALMEAVWTRPVFENWIPGVKWDAYQKTAAAHLTANPDLMMPENLLEKKVQLRRISKMIDDRFGEMQYKTQFMDNMVKDVAVASFLSYGWQLGFARSYMGAVPEAVSAFTKSEGNALYRPSQGGGTLRERIVRGDLDKTLFLQNYLMSTMLYGGLMTYAFTGEAPKEFLDYIFPKNGDKNPDGSPARVSTPFYTRELVSVPKHIEEEGLVKGLGIVLANKLSPSLGFMKGLVTNKDFFDREISNPDAPIATRMGQQLMYTLGQMEPIASSAPRKAGREAVKDYALAAAGFTPAPKYVSEGPIETEIKRFLKYHRAAVTPYEKAQRSQSVHELYQLQQLGKTDEFESKLGELTDKYKLGDKEVTRLRKEAEIPSVFRQFRMLTKQEQRKVMEKMKPDDIERFKPYAKKVIRRELD